MDSNAFSVVGPEILLLVAACVIALLDLSVTHRLRQLTYVLTMLTLGALALWTASRAMEGQTFYAFGNMIVSDPMSNWLKCFMAIAMMVCLVYGRPYAADPEMLRGGEMFTLAMFALLGMDSLYQVGIGDLRPKAQHGGRNLCIEKRLGNLPCMQRKQIEILSTRMNDFFHLRIADEFPKRTQRAVGLDGRKINHGRNILGGYLDEFQFGNEAVFAHEFGIQAQSPARPQLPAQRLERCPVGDIAFLQRGGHWIFTRLD